MHLVSVKQASGFKYWVDFTSHINWSDSQQDSFQLCSRLSSQLNKSPGIISLVLLIGEVSYNNANIVLSKPGWHARRPWEPELAWVMLKSHMYQEKILEFGGERGESPSVTPRHWLCCSPGSKTRMGCKTGRRGRKDAHREGSGRFVGTGVLACGFWCQK